MSTPPPPHPFPIVGIDPGLASVGWGVVEASPSKSSQLIAFGVIETASNRPLATRLHQIFEATSALLRRYQPRVMVVEQLFFARNAKTAMAVAHGRAATILAAGALQLEVVEYTPLQLKLALTGRGNAGKRQVQAMVRALLALPTIPEPDHAADALAAALCHAHSLGLRDALQHSTPRVLPGASHPSSTDGDSARAARKALLAQVRTRRR